MEQPNVQGLRKSRWTRCALTGVDGEPRRAYLTDRDLAVFQALDRYRYLPADYIHALVGGSYRSLTHRLNLLSREPNLYLRRPEQQRVHAQANSRTLIYELDQRALLALHARSGPTLREKRRTQFAHDLMVCQIAASFEIAVRSDPRFDIIDWTSIQASTKFPSATRALPRPVAIPIPGRHEIVPDWEPFVLVRKLGKTSFIFLPGFEADCGTEPLAASSATRSSISAKFSAYLTVIRDGIFRSHFGAQTFMVPFVTTSETRMKSMMALLAQLQPGEHARRFLFKHMPSFASQLPQPPATGHMLTAPWHRPGFEMFEFTK